MRKSTKTKRIRILLVTACVLLFGSALAASATPVHAAGNTVTVTAPAAETSTVGTPITAVDVTATDSDATQTLALSLSGVPASADLTISQPAGPGPAAATITGTFTAPFTGTITVIATDGTGATGTAPITWTAENPANTVTVTAPAAETSTVGTPITAVDVTATDSDPTQTLALSLSGVPASADLTISQPPVGSPAAATITGTFTAPFTGTITVTATDGTGATAAAPITWTAENPANTVTVTAPAAETSTVGRPITPVDITATDSDPAETLTYSATGLPPGLKLNAATGVISGTPTKAAAYTVAVTAKDPTGATDTADIAWTVGAVNRVTVTAPAKEQTWLGIPVSVKITAKDSDPTATLIYTAAGLPAGLTINTATGAISGKPQKITAGAVPVTVTATDGEKFAGKAAIKWSVGYPVVIPNPGTVTATIGQTLNVSLTDTDIASKRAHVTLSATGLPRGLLFRPNPPLVYGWPAATGSYRVTIHAKDSLGGISVMTFPLVVRFAANGPGGQIRLALNGKCLTDPGNRTGNGSRVNVSNCQTGAAQRWTVGSDGTIRVHNHCLDIAGQRGAAGQPAQLWQCTRGPREIWVQGTAGELVNPPSGLCLTASGSGTKMGACRIKPADAWTLPAGPVLAASAGTCLDDFHSVGNNGNPIDMYSCNGTPIQNWTFEPDGSIRVYGNKCVTVRTLGRVGTKVVLWTCSAANRGQHWAVVQSGSLSSELGIGGMCLAVPSLTAPDGSQLVMARCTATDPRIHWRIW